LPACLLLLLCSDVLITEIKTNPRMINFSFTEMQTKTGMIFKTETILQPFYGPLTWTVSGTTWVSRYQKGKTRKVKPI